MPPSLNGQAALGSSKARPPRPLRLRSNKFRVPPTFDTPKKNRTKFVISSKSSFSDLFYTNASNTQGTQRTPSPNQHSASNSTIMDQAPAPKIHKVTLFIQHSTWKQIAKKGSVNHS